MSSDLEVLIQIGDTILSIKYYAIATCTILFYDHLLTLADELWQITVCHRRIYAVAMKRTSVVIVFGTITVSQLAIGIWTTTFAAEGGVQPAPPIPLDAFQICIFTQNRSLEIAYTALSLSFDFLAFSLIILLAVTMRAPGLKVRSILETIAEDATKYFLIIFTSHLVVEVTLNLEQQMIRLLPAPYIPVMISRIILSLRKAADPLRKNQSLGESSDRTNLPSMKFNHPRRAAKGREDDMTIDTYSRSQTEV
ncbi:hypothetical protein BJ322DRAFT_1018258 [Thelephora terrestris]|uniref:Uncharacterized protein n=1 Tax=Thelephora terrestris TaxID=56493 RepID=A0A9P6LAA5_9AGAM|nr:hypothetical protein BJ322DRAFT_1018258 [Thelephora terrestris]